MLMPIAAVIFGLILLVWSADRFVEGAASVARHFGMPPLLIGMVIVGFGTSAPEMVVSALSAAQGNPGIALGNAYGSNITNIALIIGLTALISPIAVHSQVLRKELPLLTAVTALAAWQVWDGQITRLDAVLLLLSFAALLGWTVWQGMRKPADSLGHEMERELTQRTLPTGRATFWLVAGLLLLIASSRLLVWGAVDLARLFGVSDLIVVKDGDAVIVLPRKREGEMRDVVDRLKCAYLETRIGDEFDGLVSGVTSFGLFVELDYGRISGLVHVTGLPNDYYHFDPVAHRMKGERRGRVFQLADRVRVRVLAVNLDDRKVDFELVEEGR